MYWGSLFQVSGSDFGNTSTTFKDVPGLGFQADASSRYDIEIVISGKISGASTGGFLQVAFSSTGASGTYAGLQGNTSTSAIVLGGTIGSVAASQFWATSNTDMCAYWRGVITTGVNAGMFTVQTATRTGGTMTTYIGSILKVKKIA